MVLKLNQVTVDDAKRLYENEREFASFLNKNKNFINKIVHSFLKKNSFNKEDSEVFEDAYQEAVISLWSKALPKYTGRTKFSTFAQTVISNSVLGFLQKKTKFENKTGARIASIEEQKVSATSDGDAVAAQYRENYWIIDPSKREFESSLIEKMDDDLKRSKMNPVDFKINEFLRRGWNRDSIAAALRMNPHSFKNYYYGHYVKKHKGV